MMISAPKNFFILLTLTTLLVACNSGPDLKHSTRTGQISNIMVGEKIKPEQLQVHPGDEVRWVNMRNAPINVIFVDSLKDRLSCQNGFITGGAFKGMFSDSAPKANMTTIAPNESASLCFTAPGTYVYNARMESTVPGGELAVMGRVVVQ